MEKIRTFLNYIQKNKLYPEVKTIDGVSTEPEITIGGKKVLIFCSSNYLGLANNPEVRDVAKRAIDRYGIGVNGSRLVSGTLDIHKELEQKIANYKHTEAAITFPSGFMANTGVIPALINIPEMEPSKYLASKIFPRKKAVILSDQYNHASIIDGCRLANAKRVIFKHNDVKDLEFYLKRYKERRKLIVVDGVYSMDGDIAPLPEIIKLSKKYNALLMVDDAHATGVLGKTGRGTMEHFGITKGVDIQMGTFSKSFGAMGGYVVANKEIVDFLRISARTYIFSGAFPAALAAGIMKAIDIASADNKRRENLWCNARYLTSELKKLGFDTMGTETPIIPIMIGDEHKAIKIYEKLFSKGILAPCVRWPSVPNGQARIRVTLMATHTKAHLDKFISAMEELGKEMEII